MQEVLFWLVFEVFLKGLYRLGLLILRPFNRILRKGRRKSPGKR